MPKNSNDADLQAFENTARALSQEQHDPDVLTDDLAFISDIYESEFQVIGAIACDLIRIRGVLNSSDLILRLIIQLELTENVMQKSILRNAIALVVNRVPSDD